MSGIDDVFEPLVAQARIRALVVGATAGSFSAVRTYGAERDHVGATSIFEIGSVTKTFVGIAFAELTRRGLVSASDPLERFLPVRPRGEITLEALATHSAGVPRLPSNIKAFVDDMADPYARYPLEALCEAVADVPSDPQPVPAYSNFGYALLALALAAAADTTVPKLIADVVWQPLGMESTRYDGETSLQGHRGESCDEAAGNWAPGVFWGAGGVRSTADDLLAYIRAQIRPDATPLAEAIRDAHRPRRDLAPHQRVGYAWVTSMRPPLVVWHNGGTGGFGSFAGFCLRTRRGVVALYNCTQKAVIDRACAAWLRGDAGPGADVSGSPAPRADG